LDLDGAAVNAVPMLRYHGQHFEPCVAVDDLQLVRMPGMVDGTYFLAPAGTNAI
jgi:hypothetical protein